VFFEVMRLVVEHVIYKAQKLIYYRASSYDYFKPICSPRPYVSSFINFVKDYISPYINLGNGCRNGHHNKRRNKRRNGCIYGAQKFIDYKATSTD